MKPKRRVLSLLLAVCLVVGLMPTVALAAGTDTGKAIQLVDSAAAANIGGKQADNIYFGTYKQSSNGSGSYNTDPIKWRVLSNANGQLFLLSDQNLDVFQYHTEKENVTWETSTMRSWLNGYGAASNIGGDSGTDYTNDNFLDNAFSGKEQTAIAETAVVNDANTDYGTDGGNNTNDCIFLLSIDEIYNRNYFPEYTNFSTNTEYVAAGGKLGSGMYGAGEADWWWLRSPGFDNSTAAFMEWEDGSLVTDGNPVNNKTAAVRPAFNLDLSSVLFTSAAAHGKSSGTVGADALNAVENYNGNEWKLTILDTGRNGFSANVNGQTSVSASAGGSVQIAYSGAQTGTNEYVSVLLCDSNGNVLYYGNIAQNSASGTASLNIPAGLAAGSYTLKVFSEQCNGDYMTDYASDFQEISLTVLSKETAPNATFTATGDNGGTLSNVDTTMKYSTDGGKSWNDITGTTMDITGVTADKDIQVVKKGNGTTTSDSEAQIIDVTQAAQPAGIGKTDCTTTAQNDGTITNVGSTMEYRLSTASDWTEITGTEVTGLVNGTYEVRVKANGTVLASAAATVVIGEHTCVAQDEWKHDANGHWKLCECGAEVDRAAHTGGTATCTEKAVCDVCGEEYGEINASNHTNLVKTEAKAATHMTEGNKKYWYCNDCDKYFSDEAGTQGITLQDTVIPKLTKHTIDGTGWHSDTTNHWNTCECGEKLNEAAHTFEWVIDKEATATEAGSKHEECTVCGYAKAAVEIPATGDTTSAATGDDSNIAIWFAVMLAAGTAMTGTILYSRKRKYSK